jgi:hypothetical protein
MTKLALPDCYETGTLPEWDKVNSSATLGLEAATILIPRAFWPPPGCND